LHLAAVVDSSANWSLPLENDARNLDFLVGPNLEPKFLDLIGSHSELEFDLFKMCHIDGRAGICSHFLAGRVDRKQT
jgi:hypothetical protein